MYLICHVSLDEHLIEGSYKCMGRSYLQHVSTLLNSCDHKDCDSGCIMFLICHVTLCEYMFKGFCEFIDVSHS